MIFRFVSTLAMALTLTVAAPLSAAVTVADSYEDTAYTVTPGSGESIVLANSSLHTEGASSLQATYNFQTGGQWTKDARIAKTLAAPLDIHDASAITYDLSVPAANAAFVMVLTLTDDQGYEVRTVNHAAFSAATSGFATTTYGFSVLEKTRWSAWGRAVNLRRIRTITVRLQNQADIAAAGTFVFRLDNLRVERKPALLREEAVDDFESYGDGAALGAAWIPGSPGTSVALDTANPYAGGRAMTLRADISGRWTNYRIGKTLAAPRDLSDLKYMRLALLGDTRLSALNPTAHLFLVDDAGNRAMAYVWGWPADGAWSDIYLPFGSGGIEPYSDATTLAWGGDSCWREDAYDTGGWSGNCNLARIVQVWLSIETQNAGTYPVNGVQIGIDEVKFGWDSGIDTPAALGASLSSGIAGSVLPLGYTDTSFGTGRFLNSQPNMMTDIPGTLIYSDDPENAGATGILYRSRLAAGTSRTYIYNTNDTTTNKKITAVLENAGSATATVTYTHRAIPTPSTNYVGVGMEGLRQYYETSAMPTPLTLAPGAAALLDGTMDGRSVSRYRLAHGIHEFTSDQPLTFTTLMLPTTANTLTTFASQGFAPDDGYLREGTFNTLGRENPQPYAYDTASGIQRIRVADWNQGIDPFFEGIDAENGAASRLLGNYGGMYTIRVSATSSDGRRLAVLFAPPGNSCGYGGYLRWRFPASGPAAGLFVPTTAGNSIAPGEGGVCCLISPTAAPQTLVLETSPAGSSCLPIDIHLVPFGAPSRVEEYALY